MARTILYVDGSGMISGAEMSLLALVTHLDRRQFIPVVVCPWEGPFSKRLRAAGVEAHVLPVVPVVWRRDPIRVASYLVRSLRFALILARFARQQHVVLIHANQNAVGIPCSIAARVTHVPVVWHVRDIPATGLKRVLLRECAQHFTDATVAISQAVAKVLQRKERSKGKTCKVHVIWNGVDLAAFTLDETTMAKGRKLRAKWGITDEDILVGNVGQMIPWKGQDRLVQAAAQVIPVNPHLRFVLVGYNVSAVWDMPDDSYPQQLQRLAKRLGLDEHLIWSEFQVDMPAFMSALDIYVHTAMRPEPFGRVIIEAMACGRPVIAPGDGGILEIIEEGKTGLLYPPGDVNALSQALLELADDPARRHLTGQAARRQVETRFGIKSHVNRIQDLYETLLSPNK